MLGVGGSNLIIFKLEPTTPNTSQQGGQTHETFCTLQCCDLLHSDVATVWPELANAGPTILGYVAFRCYDHLARAVTITSFVRIILHHTLQFTLSIRILLSMKKCIWLRSLTIVLDVSLLLALTNTGTGE